MRIFKVKSNCGATRPDTTESGRRSKSDGSRVPAPGVPRQKLFSQCQAFREPGWQTGRHDFGLRRRDIVVQTPQFDRTFVHVVDHVRRPWIAVARLANAADVDEIFPTRLDLEFGVSAAAHDTVADEGHRHMRVAKKTDRGVLIGKTGLDGEPVEHVATTLRAIEGGVHESKTGHEPEVLQFLAPLAILFGRLSSR